MDYGSQTVQSVTVSGVNGISANFTVNFPLLPADIMKSGPGGTVSVDTDFRVVC
ncbi:MAG: hypothetical protein LBK13_01155 [Spirochaetales bacterium]|nr:hypothetical protein [Spirochaetales bacterium]